MDSISGSPDELPRPISLLINAHSRRGRQMLPDALQALKNAGVEIGHTHILHDRATTKKLLHQEIADGARTVIVGGGDGTLSACADDLVHTELAMGVLPLGTGNTFARSLGLPLDVEEAARVIAAGHIQAVDVGRANQQIFLNSVSLGLSCEIAGALDARTKKRLGLLAWPVVGARVLWQHRPLVLKVQSAQKTFHVRTHQLLVVNGRYVAGPVTAAPNASIQDQSLDVFVLGGAKAGSLIRTTWNWLHGNHIRSPEAHYFSARALRIESPRRPLRANVDGEINESTPLDIEVLPGALRVVVPHGFEAAKT